MKIICIVLLIMSLLAVPVQNKKVRAGGGSGIGTPAYHEPACGIGEPAYHEPAGSIGEAAQHAP